MDGIRAKKSAEKKQQSTEINSISPTEAETLPARWSVRHDKVR
jgi:hypothetical protein